MAGNEALSLVAQARELRRAGRAAEAIERFDRAIALDPALVPAHINRANALRELGQPEAAIAGYDAALSLAPDSAITWQNRGVVLDQLGRHEEAVESLERALQADKALVDAHWNLALALLRLGDFERGWREFEWRWHKPDIAMAARHFSQPRWTADQPLAGRTILVCAEQGLGDTLQFCRYLPWLAAQGARTKLLVQPELVALLSGQLGLDEVATTGSHMPKFDTQCSLMSLPYLAGTRLDTIPTPGRYLHAPAAQVTAWRERLGERPGEQRRPRIGLVWSGRPDHGNDSNRSLALQQLLDALPAGPQYVSLQNAVRPADAQALRARSDVTDFAPLLTNMAETAALCECMDLVISVDTSVAHLAGALGKPVWLLLPFSADWRWLHQRDTSPWYEHMTLLRQPVARDWAAVLGKLAQRLSTSYPCSNLPAST